MKAIRKAVRIFLIQDNKVLATKYNQKNLIGYYDVPGGKIEEDESAEEAAIREFEEEAGIIKSSLSASLEDASDFIIGSSKCSVRVFERYSVTGSNRVSLNVTIFQM